MSLNPSCSWWLPARAHPEIVKRKQPTVAGLTLKSKHKIDNQDQMEEELPAPPPAPVVVAAKPKRGGRKPKQMEVEVVPQPPTPPPPPPVIRPPEPEMLSNRAPQCIQTCLNIARDTLHVYKDTRRLTHPLLSLGSAEATFRCNSGVYYLQLSTA